MTPEDAGHSKGNILIIDDSPDNLRILSMSLVGCGYKVRCVTNSKMALVSLSHLLADLILLDIRMPIIDGYEVCRQIKMNPATQDIPIIFISAADDISGKVKAFAVGGVDYITKPFQTEEVLARIANQLTIQKLQKELRQKNQVLQREIEEHKQTQAALRDAKDAAEAANYAKSEFLARMSHELRTPLNAILGFSGLMQGDDSLSAENHDYVAGIHRGGRQLLNLLNQILAVTKAESNKLVSHNRSVNFIDFLKELASEWHRKAALKSLSFHQDVPSNLPEWIDVDDVKLRQILNNLMDNAIRCTPRGEVTLKIWAERLCLPLASDTSSSKENTPRVPLYFEVKDTGVGIPEEEISSLFNAFSSATSGRHLGGGAGLGLFTSRQFVQAMGGEITIASVPGSGTVVRFFVMTRPAPPQQDRQDLDGVNKSPAKSENRPEILAPISSFYSVKDDALEALNQDMKPQWFLQLRKAAIKGFDRQITQLIHEIPASHDSLKTLLMSWNRNFEFDQIVAITQRIAAGDLTHEHHE